MSKMPCTIGEIGYRVILHVNVEGNYPCNLGIVHEHGVYRLMGYKSHQHKLGNVFEVILQQLEYAYEDGIATGATFLMTSPTDEERAEIMRVWNEYNKEEVNEQ